MFSHKESIKTNLGKNIIKIFIHNLLLSISFFWKIFKDLISWGTTEFFLRHKNIALCTYSTQRSFLIKKIKPLFIRLRSKLEVARSANPGRINVDLGKVSNFISTSKFDLWYICRLLTYKNVQYLIWMIWFRSIWKMKAKVIEWL